MDCAHAPRPGDTEASASDVLAHPGGAYGLPSRPPLPSPGLCSRLSDVMAGIASLRTIPAQTSSVLRLLGRIIRLLCSTHQKQRSRNFYATPPGVLDGKGGCEMNLPPERIGDPRVDQRPVGGSLLIAESALLPAAGPRNRLETKSRLHVRTEEPFGDSSYSVLCKWEG